MKNRRLPIIALSALLLAVIIGGIWYFAAPAAGGPGEAPPVETPETSRPPKTVGPLFTDVSPRDQGVQYKNAAVSAIPCITLDLFSYQGQPVCLQASDDPEVFMNVTALNGGQVLERLDLEEYAWAVGAAQLCLDERGRLWALFIDYETGAAEVRVCPAGQTEATRVQLTELPLTYMGAGNSFKVWGSYVVMLGMGEDTDLLGVYDMDGQSWMMIPPEHHYSYCLDDQGGLYYIETVEDPEGPLYKLVKFSLETGEVLWRVDPPDMGARFQDLWYLPGVGLCCLASTDGFQNGAVYLLDGETGDTRYLLVDFEEDAGFTYQPDHSVYFAVDGAGGVYFVNGVVDEASSLGMEIRYLEPYYPQVREEDMVTLTITAPYPVESIESSIRMYQREHPEVQVVWDTQFATRDDYTAHSTQYSEQIAMRTMTGDVGDIQLIIGGGLSQETITDTDAFADLSRYLEDCSFQDELCRPMLEALRGEDGAIRALPLGVQPVVLYYNQTLADELGLNWDAEDLTWSQLLDLALKWKESGAEYSLFAPNYYNSLDFVLSFMIQANISGFELPDGTVDAGQPWMRELLEKFMELKDSPQLFSPKELTGDYNWINTEGFFDNCLFTLMQGVDYQSEFTKTYLAREELGLNVRMLPVPRGETVTERIAYGFCWGIPHSSEQKEEAWELLEFMISKDGLPGGEYGYDTFSLNDAADRERADAVWTWTTVPEEFVEECYEQVRAIRNSPVASYGMPGEWVGVKDPFAAYINGERTLDDAVTLATENWERFLRE